MKINRQDTNGVKPLLAVGELGYDNYPSGGDIGRVYVGTGSSNIAQAKKSEVVTVDGKVDTHVARIDNPHGVTKTQVGLSNVDNTSDVNKPVSIAVQSALDTKQDVLVSGTNVKTIEGQSIVGSGNIDLSKSAVGLDNVDNTADSAKVVHSAGKWTTSRLINGTAVDGTVDITTSQWGTSRNITIGNTTKSVNGSANTSWSLAEIGAINTASPAFTGTPTAPTAVTTDSSTTIATTAFVGSRITNDAVLKTAIESSIAPYNKGFKNYIINGNFDVWQRGTLGFDVTNGLLGTYCDMYRYANTTGQGTLSLSKSTISYSGQTYTSLKATVSSPLALSGVAYGHYFLIEDKNAKNLINKKFTVSFLMEVNYAGNYSFSVRKINDNGVVTTSFIKLIPCVTGVNKVTITVPADASYISSNSTTGIGLSISIGTYVNADTSTTEGWQSGNWASISSAYKWITQSGAYINIAQVQLEEGSVATPFENRPYGLELSLCQRYYETSGSAREEEFRNPNTGVTQYGACRFKVTKRVSPTIVVYSDSGVANNISQSYGTLAPCTVQNYGDSGFRLYWTNTAGTFGASFNWTASAEL